MIFDNPTANVPAQHSGAIITSLSGKSLPTGRIEGNPAGGEGVAMDPMRVSTAAESSRMEQLHLGEAKAQQNARPTESIL